MHASRPSPRFAYAALAAAAFIVYGSLYPFAFHGGSLPDALHALFLGEETQPQPLSGLIANIAFYMPLGLFATAAQSDARPAWRKVVWTTLAGALLCVTMETLQFFDDGRVSTLTDIYPNIIGASLGALLALPLKHWLDRPVNMNSPARRVAALLLLTFLAYRLFPYVPSLDLHTYWRALKPVVLQPHVQGLHVFRYTVIWIVAAALLADLTTRAQSHWLIVLMMLGVMCCKIVIVHNHLSLSELVALPIAVVTWQLLSSLRRGPSSGVVAVLLALVILGGRLLPFDWQAAGHAFGWMPFRSLLHGSVSINAQSLAEKAFLYASLIWLLAAAGLRLGVAGALAALGLFAASLLETHLPGRSAEITDTLIALGATLILYWAAGVPSTPQGRSGTKSR